jgi:DNA-binding GntR family transcriptional regulator
LIFVPAQDFGDILAIPHKRTLSEDVLDRLREAIYSGKLAPGLKLREEMLADFLKVSRGPVREALVQLEREGLVIKQPNRGATVARLSREDLEEVYTLRLALEQFAIRQAVQHITEKQLEALQAVVDDLSAQLERGITGQSAAELDIQFHEVIYQAAQHRRLYDFWSILRPQIHIFLLTRVVANPDFRDVTVGAHQRVIEILRTRDEERAASVIAEHIQAAYERILESYPDQNREHEAKE